MTDPVIHVSFPQPPDRYPSLHHWHAQISHFVHGALVRRFGGRVAFSPWGAELVPQGRDVLVSFLPHPAIRWWKRSVCIENATFDVDQWRFGRFRRYGLDAPLDPVADVYEWLRGQYAVMVLSNDVAIRRIQERDPQVIDCYDMLTRSARCLSVHPHPIDKPEYSKLYGRFPTPSKVRMLVYHGGPRKNSAELISTLRGMGFQENSDFNVVPHVPKDREDLLAFLRQNFLIVANTSFSETGPINMIEYLLSGHLVYGHEDWWNGAGNRDLCWTYDPARMEENRAALNRLMREMGPDAVAAERDRVWRHHMERSDNEWEPFLHQVGGHVEALLASDHPGGAE